MSVRRSSHRILRLIVLAVAVIVATPAAPAALARSAGNTASADLDGQPIELARVGTLHCHDFDHPRIHCYTTQAALDAAVAPDLAAAGTSYVLIYENVWYGGATMYVSDDYTVLAFIGWNDRISSFKSVSSGSGRFYTDWFYGGTVYSFWSNQSVPNLGSFNDTFSSVLRV